MSVWNRLRLLWYFGIRHRWVKYGDNVHVQLGCFFGGAEPVVEIGSCVGVGFNCFFLTKCRIGNRVLIASNCHFVNRTDHRYDMIGRSIWDAGRGAISWVEIEDDVWIGQSVVVLAPVVIGRGSVVAAGSVVTRDVPPYSIVAGNPAKVVKMRFTEEEAKLHEDLLRVRQEVRAE